MTELREILNKSLVDNSSLVITVNHQIPKLTLRIIDSRQMIIYGIGLDRQSGFTLYLRIDKNSNKGKKIIVKLNAVGFLTDFKLSEDKSSMIYVKNFGQEIVFIAEAVQNLLCYFMSDIEGQTYQLTVNRTDANFRLE